MAEKVRAIQKHSGELLAVLQEKGYAKLNPYTGFSTLYLSELSRRENLNSVMRWFEAGIYVQELQLLLKNSGLQPLKFRPQFIESDKEEKRSYEILDMFGNKIKPN